MVTYLMSTTGVFTSKHTLVVKYTRISVREAREILKSGFISAVGHKSTAEILTELMGFNVEYRRYSVDMQPGDVVVCFQLLSRPPEGVILTREEIDAMQFKLVRLTIE